MPAHQKSSAFHESHSAAREAHCFGDFLRDVDVGRVEENVISDEKLARAYDGGSGCGMHAGFAEVRTARGIGGDLCADAFELAAANIFETLALGDSGGGFVQVYGNLVALPDLLADMVGHGDAVFNGDAVDRDEGNDVGRAHARMRARVDVEVDEFGGLAHAADGGFLNGLALADQSDDAAVVIGVHFAIEQVDAGHFHGVDDGVNFGFVAAFREIRNTFDERGHK